MSGYQTQFAMGLAQLLAADGHGSWNPTGAYDPAQTGIYLRVLPDVANNAITIALSSLSDDTQLGDSEVGVQFILRKAGADPRPVDDLDDDLFSFLHNLAGVTLPTGIFLTLMLRTSSGSLGQDSSKRWSRSSNYRAIILNPSTHRD